MRKIKGFLSLLPAICLLAGMLSFSVSAEEADVLYLHGDVAEDSPLWLTQARTAGVPYEIPVKEGYAFCGWSTKPDSSEAEFSCLTYLDKNYAPGVLHVYPVWEPEASAVTVIRAEETPMFLGAEEFYCWGSFTPESSGSYLLASFDNGDRDLNLFIYNEKGENLRNIYGEDAGNNFSEEMYLKKGETYLLGIMSFEEREEDISFTLQKKSLGYPFKDMKGDEWYAESIFYTAKAEIMNGVSAGVFAPMQIIPRAQMAVVLYNLTGKPTPSVRNVFLDVPEGVWYSNAINFLYEKKVASGYTNHCFGVNDKLNREQMVTFLYRLIDNMSETEIPKEYLDPECLKAFKDHDSVSDYARDAMSFCVNSGIITGKDNNTRLDPLGPITRAEAAIIIHRAFLQY